jgi:hypothetical protein
MKTFEGGKQFFHFRGDRNWDDALVVKKCSHITEININYRVKYN